jgi:crotonobetainyl-CoA:carnitine CoA-transferase CaiB-like acyl-CoA transferase
VTAAQAITSALYYRERTGQGQHIRLSMLETMLAFFWPEGMGGLTFADKEYDVTRGQGTMDLIFEARDGYLTAGAISDSEWRGVCRALDREDLVDDERFSSPVARGRNADARKQIMADEIAKWRRDEILARFDAHDVPSAPLLTRMELMDHEQIRVNGSIARTTWADFGEVRKAIPAARFSLSPSEIKRPAPRLGEHSREILAGLGYDEDRRQTLISAGVVAAL